MCLGDCKEHTNGILMCEGYNTRKEPESPGEAYSWNWNCFYSKYYLILTCPAPCQKWRFRNLRLAPYRTRTVAHFTPLVIGFNLDQPQAWADSGTIIGLSFLPGTRRSEWAPFYFYPYLYSNYTHGETKRNQKL
jgi:hypothetical protein